MRKGFKQYKLVYSYICHGEGETEVTKDMTPDAVFNQCKNITSVLASWEKHKDKEKFHEDDEVVLLAVFERDNGWKQVWKNPEHETGYHLESCG